MSKPSRQRTTNARDPTVEILRLLADRAAAATTLRPGTHPTRYRRRPLAESDPRQVSATMATKAGMPNDAILKSATLISARAAGQQRDMGSIEPGKLANMVVLTRNPLADLKNLRSVLMTVKRGRVYARSAFVPLVKDDITDR